MRCRALRCVIVCRSVLQGVPSGLAVLICRGPAIYSGARGKEKVRAVCVTLCCSLLQCVAVCRIVMQCVTWVPICLAMLICRIPAVYSGGRGREREREREEENEREKERERESARARERARERESERERERE